jgi:predicted Zn-dependent protease
MRRLLSLLVAAPLLMSACAEAPRRAADGDGVAAGSPSVLRNMVSAEQVNKAAAQQYSALKEAARDKGVLVANDDPRQKRLREIAARILPYAERHNADAAAWRWEVILVDSRQLNASCMPGGKITFYTGLIEQLKLTDDEIAIVMGHEIAHALLEHARERIAKGQLTNIGAIIIGELLGGGIATSALRTGGNLMTLKFSRDDESEADIIGLDLAARAGYDPRAGISLWRKMGAASKDASAGWLSTHPAGEDRIAEIERYLPDVMPLYEAARQKPPGR